MKLAVAAILRNEGPFLREWIAYHRALGVDHFFLANNESTDDTGLELRKLEDIGVVTGFDIPGEGRQLPAYELLTNICRGKADWVAFIDADEFILPAGNRSIPAMLALAAGPDTGTIALNWACYGSSGQEVAGESLVMERFPRRASKAFWPNRHYKSIVRPKAVARWRNPHHAELLDGWQHVTATGRRLVVGREGIGISAELDWSAGRINHYVVKSRAEFRQKQARGMADIGGGLKRPDSFFEVHDQNDEIDPTPARLISATHREMANMHNSGAASLCGLARRLAARWMRSS